MGSFCFLHAADLHLDSPLRGLDASDAGLANALRGASRRAFQALCDYALDRQVAFLVIAGDLYDGAWRDVATGLFFLRQVQRLIDAGIRVFALHGNHDFESPLVRNLRGRLPAGLDVFPDAAPGSFELPELGVCLHGQSYPSKAVPADLTRRYPAPVAGRLNIGVLHTSAGGGTPHETYAPVSVERLRGFGYDYWALGHVHQVQVLSTAPPAIFPGNLQGRHARETGPKGVFEVEVVDGRVGALRHVHLDHIRWHAVELDAEGLTDEAELIDAAVRGAADALAARPVGSAADAGYEAVEGLRSPGDRAHVVRLIVRGATPLHGALAADVGAWRDRFALAFARLSALHVEALRLRTSPVRAAGPAEAEGLANLEAEAGRLGLLLVDTELREVEDKLRPALRAFGEPEEREQGLAPALDGLPERAAALLRARLRAGGGP